MSIAEIVTSIILTLTMIVAIIQLFLSRCVAKMDFDRRKKEATIEFTHEILELVADLRQVIRDEFAGEPVKYSEYKSNTDMKKCITKYLNIMERISVGINSGVYDIDIFSCICRRTTVLYWEQLSHVIVEKRNEMQCQSLFIEYERVANKLKDMSKQKENHAGDLTERI